MIDNSIICWWSGGVTSAVACKLAINLFGIDRCQFIMIDTMNEDDDTYRFKNDCEKWYDKKIETISAIPNKYKNIQEVWYKNNSLNVAKGAVCSSALKRQVSDAWAVKNPNFKYQIFGFHIKEVERARTMTLNKPKSNPIYPLLLFGMTKEDCVKFLLKEKIDPPIVYKLGFQNNNCFKTGCVQGGIGYWQKMKRDFPDKFEAMARIEHDLTDAKKTPVTMLRDQTGKMKRPLFLKPHPDYPNIKHIMQMNGRPPTPLMECNGFCFTNDLSKRSPTINEINFDDGSQNFTLF